MVLDRASVLAEPFLRAAIMHFVARQVLGARYLDRYTMLTRNDLHVGTFEKLAGEAEQRLVDVAAAC